MPYRTMCDVLRELRAYIKVCGVKKIKKNHLLCLVEEVQTMGNRMENALWVQKDIKHLQEELKKLKKKRNTLRKKVDNLEGKKE